MRKRLSIFGTRSGFDNVRDILVFAIGVAGMAPQVYEIACGGQVNLGTLMFFGGFLAAPSVISSQVKKK